MSTPGRPWKAVKQDLLRDPKVRKAYDELEPEFQLAGGQHPVARNRHIIGPNRPERGALWRMLAVHRTSPHIEESLCPWVRQGRERPRAE